MTRLATPAEARLLRDLAALADRCDAITAEAEKRRAAARPADNAATRRDEDHDLAESGTSREGA